MRNGEFLKLHTVGQRFDASCVGVRARHDVSDRVGVVCKLHYLRAMRGAHVSDVFRRISERSGYHVDVQLH
jgi:hypothetical protein